LTTSVKLFFPLGRRQGTEVEGSGLPSSGEIEKTPGKPRKSSTTAASARGWARRNVEAAEYSQEALAGGEPCSSRPRTEEGGRVCWRAWGIKPERAPWTGRDGTQSRGAGPKRTCGMAYAASPASPALLDDAAFQTFSKYVKCNGEDRDCDDQLYSEHYLAHRQWWLNYVATMPQAMCAE